MENRSTNEHRMRNQNSGKTRIKNITPNVEEQKDDLDTESILPKVNWDERMAAARNTAARTRDTTSDGGPSYSSGRRRIQDDSAHRPRTSSTGTPGRPRKPPTTAGQISREFEEDERRRKQQRKNKKKGKGTAAKIVALLLVFVVIAGSVFVMRNFSAGSSSNRKGSKYYQNGDYTNAIALFNKALTYDSKNSEYYINLGMAHIALKEYETALAAFDNAVKNTRRDELLQMAKRGSGMVYLYEGYYTKAEELFIEALSYKSGTYTENEIDILYYLAEAQDRAGDAVGAVLSYTEIINQQEDANAYMLRGLAYQKVGDNTNAEKDLDIAINMSKKNYKTYLALYEVLVAQDKGSEAKKTLQNALELGGKTGEDYSNRGIVYMYMEDYVNAETAFNTALEKGYDAANLGLAESLVRQMNYNDAITQYESYLSKNQSNATAYNQYGLCLMKVERYEEAAAAFGSGLALNDRLVDRQLLFNEAVIYEYLVEWQTAYTKMQEFVAKYPDDEQGQRELIFLESRL